jgi:hypothetical protein
VSELPASVTRVNVATASADLDDESVMLVSPNCSAAGQVLSAMVTLVGCSG